MLLRFLPGKRTVFDQGASQVNDPARQGRQFSPTISSFFGLEPGQCPSQGIFAEMDARFDGPTLTVSPPNRFGGDEALAGIA